MSLNVSNSKYVTVSNVGMNFNFSKTATIGKLRTFHKTNIPKTGEDGKVIINDITGETVMEYKQSYWDAVFVGNATERSKELKNGARINIINGWIEQSVSSNGEMYCNVFISDFEISDNANQQELETLLDGESGEIEDYV